MMSTIFATWALVAQSTAPADARDSRLGAQTAELWHDVLLPMWQRFASSLPSLVKALLLLLLFWLLAIIAGAAVRRLLDLTRIDERAARDWGLDGALRRPDGSTRSVSGLAGRVVRWILMLFGLVAFFQALNLEMVATPLQNVADTIIGVLPNLLAAAVILFVYWIVASVVRLGVTKLLTAVRFDERAGRYLGGRERADAIDTEGAVDADADAKGDTDVERETAPSAVIGRLVFYLILLLALPPFLDALGQTALVAPLVAMLGKALAFVPNIFAAVLLFVIGKLVATIVREVSSNALAASGIDGAAERFGITRVLGTRRPSQVIGALAYFFILLSVIVAAIDALRIEAIAAPVQSTLARILAAIPALFVALVVVAIGWAVARAVREGVTAFLAGVGVDGYPERFGLTFLSPREGRPTLSAIGGTAAMVVILLLTAEQALATLDLERLAALVGDLIAYLPSLLAGVAIVLVALAVAGIAARLVGDALGDSAQARLAVPLTRWSIVFLGVSMGLSQLGVGERIVTVAVSAALFGIAAALALAFGLGGRDRARELIEKAGR